MLLIVVVVFIICHSTDWAMVFFVNSKSLPAGEDMNKTFGERSRIEWQICFLVLTLNSSVNVVIYCFKDKHFREVASHIIGSHLDCTKQVTGELPPGSKEEPNKDLQVIKRD